MHLMGQLLILSTLITGAFPTPTPPLPQIFFFILKPKALIWYHWGILLLFNCALFNCALAS